MVPCESCSKPGKRFLTVSKTIVPSTGWLPAWECVCVERAKASSEGQVFTSHFSVDGEATGTLRFHYFEVLINTRGAKGMATFVQLLRFCAVVQANSTSIHFFEIEMSDKGEFDSVAVLRIKTCCFHCLLVRKKFYIIVIVVINYFFLPLLLRIRFSLRCGINVAAFSRSNVRWTWAVSL